MALVFDTTDFSHPRVAVWEITETEQDLLNLLPPFRKEEADFLQKISHPPRRMEWLASRVLIHHLTGLYPATAYKENGQPYIKGCHEHISISHTKDYAAIVLSEETIPGVDIEYPSDRIRKVSDRFLNEKEKAFISEPYSDLQIGLIWCAKEAIYKAVGIPGLIFKDQIIISTFHPDGDQGVLKATLKTPSRKQQFQIHYRIEKNYFLVWTK
ncbi:4'-phosphopantetheinyl transferase family protein [Thermophagus sp. OGC60D27]|uniref:4'-phosphopantetheinyl transferase family protein n=1 Tax=Thermophagus sp. OGC60D27 TaxID=3458415 RepID=UPI00403821BE